MVAARVAALALLLAVAVGAAWTHPAGAQDPLGVAAEMEALRAATETMVATVEALPEAVRHEFEAEVQVLAQSARQTLAELEYQRLPLVQPDILHELAYLRDIVATITSELQLAADAVGQQAEAAVERVQQLSAAAGRPLGQIDAALETWHGQVADAVVEVEEREDAVVVRTTNQLLHDAIRYGAAGLFLVGLLVLGLRLLALGESEVGLVDLFKHAPVMSIVGFVAVLGFLAATLVLALNPGALAGPSQVRIEARQHPCTALAAQRHHLREAQQVGVESLVGTITQRMEATAQGCLGLASPEAASRAVARFAASPPEPEVGPAVAAREPDPGLRADLDRLITTIRELATELPAPPETPLEAEAAAVARELEQEVAAEEEPAAAEPAAAPEPPAAEEDEAPVAEGDEARAAEQDEAPDAPAVAEPAPAPAPEPAQPAPSPAPRDFVTTTALNYRTGPSLDAARLGTLPEGTPVLLLGEQDGWASVQLEDGRSVYVSSEFIRPAG